MSELVVRAYNVGFGDAVLVSIPEADTSGGAGAGEVVRHVLIDVGNLLAGSANEDKVFQAVAADIAARTNGVVDLYVMTHEHLDHVQGLLAASNAGVALAARSSWLTSSSAPDYYDRFPTAKKKRLDGQQQLTDVVNQLGADTDPWLAMMIRNNAALLPDGVLGLRTSDYVDHLRTLAPADATFYVDRGFDPAQAHPFTEATFRILAPEPDTSTYYGRRSGRKNTTMALDAAPTESTSARSGRPKKTAATRIAPPVGVDAGAFFDLVSSRRNLNRLSIMEIDAAANNTSVVLEIEWRGWRLLFPGDAEERSWLMMHEQGLLRPVHFVKVSHHGSINGTEKSVFDDVMPAQPPDGRERRAVVSTHIGDWDSVPDSPTLDLYRSRCTLFETSSVDRGQAVELRFPA